MDDVIEIWGAEQSEAPFLSQEEFGKALESIMKHGGDGLQAGMPAAPSDNQ